MEESIEEIIIEKARDGNDTCKVQIGGKWKYLYSKYRPSQSVSVADYEEGAPCVLLGLGLGYEILELLKKQRGDQPLYVIEKHPFFFEYLQNNKELKRAVEESKVRFFVGEDYLNCLFERPFVNFVRTKLTDLEAGYYGNVLRHFQKNERNRRERPKVMVLDHVTIAKDCADAFRKLGYDVIEQEEDVTTNQLFIELGKTFPDYLFSINPNQACIRASKRLKIPYIYWIVDTPAYLAYSKETISDHFYCFVYDKVVAKQLKSFGYTHVEYLPVAVNTDRLDQVKVERDEWKKYQAEVAFIGHSGNDNEYDLWKMEEIDPSLQHLFKCIFAMQTQHPSEPVLKTLVNEDLLNTIEAVMGPLRTDELMSRQEKLFYILGRKYSQIERRELVEMLSDHFKLKVYGDESWGSSRKSKLSYMGYAEHYTEMIKIMRCSAININATRVFVESGLPMRIFDVLGSKGFLVSNTKSDMTGLLKEGRDLVVYRDLKELKEVIDHYLFHEKERAEITSCGYETVKQRHTYVHRIREMMASVKEKVEARLA